MQWIKMLGWFRATEKWTICWQVLDNQLQKFTSWTTLVHGPSDTPMSSVNFTDISHSAEYAVTSSLPCVVSADIEFRNSTFSLEIRFLKPAKMSSTETLKTSSAALQTIHINECIAMLRRTHWGKLHIMKERLADNTVNPLHKFTVYKSSASKNDNAFCYLWSEVDRNRGGNKIGKCIFS